MGNAEFWTMRPFNTLFWLVAAFFALLLAAASLLLREKSECVKKTVLVVLLTVFTMAVIWATIVLLFTISSQFVTMIREVYYEIVYRL